MRIIEKTILFLFLLLAVVSKSFTAEISGTITGVQNFEPIDGASVLLIGTEFSAITDSDGSYVIREVPSGHYSIRISAVGYASKRVSYLVTSSSFSSYLNSSLEKIDSREIISELSTRSDGVPLNERRRSSANSRLLYLTKTKVSNLTASTEVGSIIGTISDKNTERTLAGASITMRRTTFSEVTDEYGKFELQEVSPGKYFLKVKWTDQHFQYVELTVKKDYVTTIGLEVTFDSFTDSSYRDEFISSDNERFQVLEGLITNKESGEPIVGATITLVDTDFTGKSVTNGIFKIEKIPVGVYTLKISAFGFVTKEVEEFEIFDETDFFYNFKLESTTFQTDY